MQSRNSCGSASMSTGYAVTIPVTGYAGFQPAVFVTTVGFRLLSFYSTVNYIASCGSPPPPFPVSCDGVGAPPLAQSIVIDIVSAAVVCGRAYSLFIVVFHCCCFVFGLLVVDRRAVIFRPQFYSFIDSGRRREKYFPSNLYYETPPPDCICLLSFDYSTSCPTAL